MLSVFRPMGVVGGEFTNPVTFVSIAPLLILLRYVSICIISSEDVNKKEITMAKTLTTRIRVFISALFESSWAIGIGSVVAHLST